MEKDCVIGHITVDVPDMKNGFVHLELDDQEILEVENQGSYKGLMSIKENGVKKMLHRKIATTEKKGSLGQLSVCITVFEGNHLRNALRRESMAKLPISEVPPPEVTKEPNCESPAVPTVPNIPAELVAGLDKVRLGSQAKLMEAFSNEVSAALGGRKPEDAAAAPDQLKAELRKIIAESEANAALCAERTDIADNESAVEASKHRESSLQALRNQEDFLIDLQANLVQKFELAISQLRRTMTSLRQHANVRRMALDRIASLG